VKDGKVITSAGVSAGIDMSLYLLSLVVNENYAKAVQLGIEYDPKPPFDSGSPEKAPKEILDKVKQPFTVNHIPQTSHPKSMISSTFAGRGFQSVPDCLT
jgi:hypothetical protein